MVIKSIKIKEISGFHDSVKELVGATISAMYELGPHECSKLLLANLLKLHPLHVVKSESDYQLIAGFRTYEIARLLLEDDQTIDCLLHESSTISETELINLALSDIVGTSVLLNFSANPKAQLKTIVDKIGKERVKALYKDISSKQKIDVRNTVTF
jgi:hypothetical protein